MKNSGKIDVLCFLETTVLIFALLHYYRRLAHVKKYGDKQIKIKSPLTKLKDSLSLADKANQSINQFCGNIATSSLPVKFVKFGENAEESSIWLLGIHYLSS